MKSMYIPMLVLLALVGGSLFFAWQGINMHGNVSIEESKFHDLQEEYFTLNKAERDGAATGSELNQQLVQIKNYPSDLLRLKLVGVGKILTGILLALLAIVFLLFMMPVRLEKLVKEKNL